MSDLMSKIHEDTVNYQLLAKHFNEPVQYTADQAGNRSIDTYGTHASKLSAQAYISMKGKVVELTTGNIL